MPSHDDDCKGYDSAMLVFVEAIGGNHVAEKKANRPRVSVSDFSATQGIGKGAAIGAFLGFNWGWWYHGWWYWEDSDLASIFYGIIWAVIGVIVGGVIGQFIGKRWGRYEQRKKREKTRSKR